MQKRYVNYLLLNLMVKGVPTLSNAFKCRALAYGGWGKFSRIEYSDLEIFLTLVWRFLKSCEFAEGRKKRISIFAEKSACEIHLSDLSFASFFFISMSFSFPFLTFILESSLYDASQKRLLDKLSGIFSEVWEYKILSCTRTIAAS